MSEDIHAQIDKLDSYIEVDKCDQLPDDYLICECNCVSVADIKNEFTRIDDIDFELLKNKYLFGTGCQSCIKNKADWINKIFQGVR